MSNSNTQKHIAIMGAGLVGSLAAIFLLKRGYKVSIFERRSDMRKTEHKGGKSINLALSSRGWLPLSQVGLEKEVGNMVTPMNGRMMHSIEGDLTFQAYGKQGQAINSISRSGLNELLITKAEENGAKVHFDHQCVNVDIDKTRVTLDHFGSEKDLDFDIIIGADGAFSAVRSALQQTDRFDYSQNYIPHGYKELRIPPGKGGEFMLDKIALHIWPRGNFMLIALPNSDGSFTVTLFLAFEGKHSFESIRKQDNVREFFKTHFNDVYHLLSTLEEDWRENPASSLVTVKSYPWFKNKTLLIGDAAHAVVPFYGQGMNCGFEDCRVLNNILESTDDNWEQFLPAYQESRKPDADAIADLALQNFIEMRDLVGDRRFLLRKKIEARLQKLYPEKWIPLYSMVTFNERIRYSEANEIGIIQKQIMDGVMEKDDIETSWESLDFHHIVSLLPD